MSSKTRVIRNISAGLVAGIAGYASYWHQVAVAEMAGERTELAHILPGSVDGLLVVASIAMVDARSEGRKPSWQTKTAFTAGIAASIGANIMSAHPTVLGRVVAAWPAVALLLVVEAITSQGRKLIKVATQVEAAISVAVAQTPVQPVAVVTVPVPAEATTDEAAISVAELVAPDLPEAPQSPAPVGTIRQPYGPRDGEQYSDRHQRRQRSGR